MERQKCPLSNTIITIVILIFILDLVARSETRVRAMKCHRRVGWPARRLRWDGGFKYEISGR
jgi:hypothetical protein